MQHRRTPHLPLSSEKPIMGDLKRWKWDCRVFIDFALQWLQYGKYGTCHKKLYEIQQILRKFCVDSVKLLCS